SEEPLATDMIFNNEGTVLYVVGTEHRNVYAYTLSTPYDLSTASFDEIALSVISQENAPTAMLFNDDGTVFYLMGLEDDDINAYNVGTTEYAWMSTAANFAVNGLLFDSSNSAG